MLLRSDAGVYVPDFFVCVFSGEVLGCKSALNAFWGIRHDEMEPRDLTGSVARFILKQHAVEIVVIPLPMWRRIM